MFHAGEQRHDGQRFNVTGDSSRDPGPDLLQALGDVLFRRLGGLMVLSQAREIVAAYGGAATLAVAATTASVLAGFLFDMTRACGTAVLIAAGANIAGTAMALTLPRRGWREGG